MAFPKNATARQIAAGTRLGTGTPPPRTDEPKSREARGLYQSELEHLPQTQQASGSPVGESVTAPMLAEANRRFVPDKRGPAPLVVPGARVVGGHRVVSNTPTP